MHIGIDASRAATGMRTGTEHYSIEVIRRLVPLAAGRHHFTLYASQPLPPELAALPVERRVMGPARLWTHLGLGPGILRYPPDLLWVPAHVLPFPGFRPRYRVATIHDLGHRYYPQLYTPLQRHYLEYGTRWNILNSQKLLADSYATRDDLINLYNVKPDKIAVTQLGVDEQRRIPASAAEIEQVRARYGISGPYILSIGTVQPRKNIARLLAAYEHPLNKGLAHQLVLIGKQGWLVDQALGTSIEPLIERKRLIITGYVPDADLHALLSGADAFALVSLFEGFGLPLVEALALGIPALASAVSSLPEVAGNAAVLVDPLNVEAIAEGLNRVVLDNRLRADLRRQGPLQADRFSWERCATETLIALEATAGLL